jgi:ankyrin repeat protein
MMQNLRQVGWDVNGRDYDGRTAAHIAASEGHLNTIKYLLAFGADLSIRDSRDNDPIDDAIREKRFEVQQYLR